MRRMILGSMVLASLCCGAGELAAGTAPARLLITEFVVTPTAGEFVEIYNPNSFTVDLTDVYLTDATFAGGGTAYYNIVTGSNAGGGSFGDWLARFPAGASIGPGEFQTVTLNGSIGFTATYGIAPTYEIAEDDGAPDAIPDMLPGLAGSIGAGGPGANGLTNDGEVVILFYWDGESDLVIDLDYVVYGDKVEAVDKTGVAIDGPDADAVASTYAADTAIALQDVPAAGQPHASGSSAQRVMLSEGKEVRAGGNGLVTASGLTGNDETSENTSQTWSSGAPTPNAKASANMTLVIAPGAPGNNTVTLKGATPSDVVFFLAGTGEGYISTEGKCPGIGEGLGISVAGIQVVAAGTDVNGEISLPAILPSLSATLHLQVIDLNACTCSNMNETPL